MLKYFMATIVVFGIATSEARSSRTRLVPKAVPKRVLKKKPESKVFQTFVSSPSTRTKTKSSYNLGEIPVGDTGTGGLIWSIPGSASPTTVYTFSATTASTPGFAITSDGCSGATLTAGQSCTIDFEYNFSTSGVKIGNFATPHSYVDSSTTPPASGSFAGAFSFAAYAVAPPPAYEENPENLDQQAVCPGSIVQVDSLTLGEMIPVVGTDFSLSYTSGNANEFVTSSPKAHRISFFNPEGISISGHYYYDKANLRLFDGSGSSRTAKYIEDDGEILVASADASEIYHFDSSGRHLATRNSLTGGLLKLFSYTSGKLLYIGDAYSNVTTFNRNSSGVLVSITAPHGQITTIGTNSSGLVTSVTNPMSQVYTFTYKPGTELLATFTKPGGQVSTFTYDTDGKLTQDLGNGGDKWDFLLSLLVDQRTINKSSAMSRSDTYYFWAENGDNHRYVDYASGAWSDQIEGYNQSGDHFYQEGLGVTEYKDIDPRLGILNKLPSEQHIVADDDGVIRQKDTYYDRYATGVKGIYDFQSTIDDVYVFGRQVSTDYYTSSNREFFRLLYGYATSRKTVDQYGKITSSKVGNDDAWTFWYDTSGRMIEKRQGAASNKTTYTYNSAGFLDSETNARSETTAYSYDLAGRVTQVTLPDSRVVGFSYDANGNRTGVTPPSRPQHEFEFNAMELLGAYKPPALTGVSVKDTTYSYNLDKQLTSVVRPDTQSVDYVYGSTSGLLEEVQLARGTDYYSYKPWSEQVSQIDSADGIRSKYTYFGKQLKSEEQRLASTDALLAKIEYLFDDEHRNVGRVLYGNGSTSTISISYNGASVPTQIGDLELTYDNPSGRLATTTIDKISDARTYDSLGNLESYTATYNPTSGSPVQLYSYTLSRDVMSRIVGKTETIGGVTSTYVYNYDTAGRLTSVDKNSVTTSSYTYDNNGNKTSGSIGGTSFSATYDNQDRINSWNSVLYSHNANGDNTGIQWTLSTSSAFNYDALGRLLSATTPTQSLTYEYDGRGRQVRVASSGSTLVRRIYEDDLRIAAEFDDSGVVSKEYVFGSSVNAPEYVIIGGVKYRYIKDHLGSARLLVKVTDGTIAQRIDYNENGHVTYNSNPGFQAYGFAGGIYDEAVSLVKFGARWYDPSNGRWTTKDPIRFDGGDMNLFGYVQNDPINFIDPKGQSKTMYYLLKFLIEISGETSAEKDKMTNRAYTEQVIFEQLDPCPGVRKKPARPVEPELPVPELKNKYPNPKKGLKES